MPYLYAGTWLFTDPLVFNRILLVRGSPFFVVTFVVLYKMCATR